MWAQLLESWTALWGRGKSKREDQSREYEHLNAHHWVMSARDKSESFTYYLFTPSEHHATCRGHRRRPEIQKCMMQNRVKKQNKTWITWEGLRNPRAFQINFRKTPLSLPLHFSLITCSYTSVFKKPAEWLDIHHALLHRGFSSINHGFFQALGGMFINAAHLKHPAQAITHRCLPWIFSKKPPLSTHTYFSLLTGLTVRPIRLIVQLLGDHAQEFSLVFVSIVVWGPYADQLGRHKAEQRAALDRLNNNR